MEVLQLLCEFENVDDRETETAFYRTHVPWVAPLAYLNVVFKHAPEDVLHATAAGLRMPACVVDFLKHQNGAALFSGALSIYGVHRRGQQLNRGDLFFDLPFNIEFENDNWPPFDPTRFLAIGGYGFDGSGVCIDRDDSKIYLFKRGQQALLSTPLYSWESLEDWITSEVARFSALFDKRGKRLVDESKTLPMTGSPF